MGTDNTLVAALEPYRAGMQAVRRDIHQNPETAFEEVRTAAIVAEKLRGWGLDVTEGIATTGVVATLRGTGPASGGGAGGNRAVGLRADMDALHIQEVPGRAHGSAVPGKMHACGHDGHTAMLLGAAQYLAEHPGSFAGQAVFIFQPAEEGLGGGREMVKEGLFERFPVDAVYGMHNLPGIPVGEFHTRVGPFLAASDSWKIVFTGSGGHGGGGAHLATDPTLAVGGFIQAVQTIVSRNVAATDTAVVSIGSIHGGDPKSPNIIPSTIEVTGTARSYTPDVRDTLERRLGEIARIQAQVFGCAAELHYNRRYPPLVTHAAQTDISVAAAAELVGQDHVQSNARQSTGAEDFSFMLEARPGGFVFIGNGPGADVHRPDYEFNDDILTLGAAYWVKLVQTELAGS